MYPPHKLIGLAVSAVITELDRADNYWIGGYGPGPDTENKCRTLLSDYYGVDSRGSAIQSITYFLQKGDTFKALGILNALGKSPQKDSAKQKIVRAGEMHIRKNGLIAWDLARAVMVAGRSCWANHLTENEAWDFILLAAAKAQKVFSSWKEFAENYELGRSFWANGEPHAPTAKIIAHLLNDPDSFWAKVPFKTELGQKPIDAKDQAQSRMKKTICPGCGAPKTRPSQTAYVYCDYCGALADYDFQKAKENPAAQPGPVYEAIVAQLQAPLAQARAKGDQAAYYQLQERLFGAWVDACPNAIPPRAREEEYRRRYIAYMARANTLAAFDPEAEKHQAAVNQAVAGLQWTTVAGGGYRVGAPGWEKLVAALFPQQEYLADLNKREGVFAQQPDGAGDEVQRRITYSLFVQGWLPMITEDQAQALLARTNLAGEYISVPSTTDAHACACAQCGTTLEIPAGAKKTVCEFCGHVLNATAPTVDCPGCQAALTPTADGTAVNCPYCGTEIKRVG
jgi:hypothetical protein